MRIITAIYKTQPSNSATTTPLHDGNFMPGHGLQRYDGLIRRSSEGEC